MTATFSGFQRRGVVKEAMELLEHMREVNRCLDGRGSPLCAAGGAARADGKHRDCKLLRWDSRAKDGEQWRAVARTLASIAVWAEPDTAASGRGRLAAAWIEWTRNCGRLLEDVDVTAAVARTIRSFDEDGTPLTTVPFVQYAHPGFAPAMLKTRRLDQHHGFERVHLVPAALGDAERTMNKVYVTECRRIWREECAVVTAAAAAAEEEAENTSVPRQRTALHQLATWADEDQRAKQAALEKHRRKVEREAQREWAAWTETRPARRRPATSGSDGDGRGSGRARSAGTGTGGSGSGSDGAGQQHRRRRGGPVGVPDEVFMGWLDRKEAVATARALLRKVHRQPSALRPTAEALFCVSPSVFRDVWATWAAAVGGESGDQHLNRKALANMWMRCAGPVDAVPAPCVARRRQCKELLRREAATLKALVTAAEEAGDAVSADFLADLSAQRASVEAAQAAVRRACVASSMCFREGFPDAHTGAPCPVLSVPVVDATSGEEDADVYCNAKLESGDFLWGASALRVFVRVSAWLIDAHAPAFRPPLSSDTVNDAWGWQRVQEVDLKRRTVHCTPTRAVRPPKTYTRRPFPIKLQPDADPGSDAGSPAEHSPLHLGDTNAATNGRGVWGADTNAAVVAGPGPGVTAADAGSTHVWLPLHMLVVNRSVVVRGSSAARR